MEEGTKCKIGGTQVESFLKERRDTLKERGIIRSLRLISSFLKESFTNTERCFLSRSIGFTSRGVYPAAPCSKLSYAKLGIGICLTRKRHSRHGASISRDWHDS